MALSESQILAKEREVHLNVPYKYKGKTYYHEKIVGYIKEDIMQADFIQWAWATYPNELRFTLFHIENEGSESGGYGAFRGGQALSKGKLAGVFDNLCVFNNRMVWIELKLPGKTLSDNQKKLKEKWEKMGIEIFVVTTFEEWKRVIEVEILCLHW